MPLNSRTSGWHASMSSWADAAALMVPMPPAAATTSRPATERLASSTPQRQRGSSPPSSKNASDSLRSALSTATVLIMKAPLTMCPDATGRCDGICPNGIAMRLLQCDSCDVTLQV